MPNSNEFLSADVKEFVHSLYQDPTIRSLSRDDILAELDEHTFPADVRALFSELPVASYDEPGLIGALQDIAERY